jgi:hypothetical protein
LLAAEAQKELVVSFSAGTGLGTSGEIVGDLALLGLGAATALFRGRRRAPEELLVTDVLTAFSVQDPMGVLTGQAREVFAHWPALESPPRWVQSARRAMRAQEVPVDAPPRSLALSMTAQGYAVDDHQPRLVAARALAGTPDRLGPGDRPHGGRDLLLRLIRLRCLLRQHGGDLQIGLLQLP